MTALVRGLPKVPDLDRAIARILIAAAYLSVALLAVGVVGMLLAGRSPLEAAIPALDVASLPSDLAAARPEAFLWLGLVAVIATPSLRVAASMVGYLVAREWVMAAVSAAILAVIALSVVVARNVEG